MRRAEEAAIEMQRDPFTEIALPDETAREQNDGAVDPHRPCLAERNGPLRRSFGEAGEWAATGQEMDDADKQDDRKEADGVVEHIGYGRCGGEFGPVERNAVPAEQDSGAAQQEPEHEGHPQTGLPREVFDTRRRRVGHSLFPFLQRERLLGEYIRPSITTAQQTATSRRLQEGRTIFLLYFPSSSASRSPRRSRRRSHCERRLAIQRSTIESPAGSMRQVRTRPTFCGRTRPLSSSICRCCTTAASVMSSGLARLETDVGP